MEPWRDWAVLTVLNHGALVSVWLLDPAWPVVVLIAAALGVTMSTAVLTVLHDAGHRRLSRREWPNVLAVQTSAPVGLWVSHWTLKHRAHHRVTQVYPLDEATHSSGIVRLHPGAPLEPIHRYQHVYAWPMYGLAWLGELRSQVNFLRSGQMYGVEVPARRTLVRSYLLEKALCLAVIGPYFWLLGPLRMTAFMLIALTWGSFLVGVLNVVGHINIGLWPTTAAPRGRDWTAHVVGTTASFSLKNPLMRWFSGGLTHHLAHHLRPVAPRYELPALHDTLVAQAARESGMRVIEYDSLAVAMRGHWQALRLLGRITPESVAPKVEYVAPAPAGAARLTGAG